VLFFVEQWPRRRPTIWRLSSLGPDQKPWAIQGFFIRSNLLESVWFLDPADAGRAWGIGLPPGIGLLCNSG